MTGSVRKLSWLLVGVATVAACLSGCSAAKTTTRSPVTSRLSTSNTTSSATVAPSAPTLSVTPSRGLSDGQVVTVNVRGLPAGIKFFVSECLTPADASHEGCGPQLAQQPFGVTDTGGSGSTSFTVYVYTASSPNSQVVTPCAGECVIVAVPDTSSGRPVLAPIAFAAVATSTSLAAEPPPGLPRCHTDQLAATLGQGGAAAGNIGVPLILRNVSSVTCYVFGYVGMQLVDGARHFLPTNVIRGSSMIFPDPGPRTITVAPGAEVSAGIGYEDVPIQGIDPGMICPESTYLEITPPDETTYLFIPARLGPCGRGTLDVTALETGGAPQTN